MTQSKAATAAAPSSARAGEWVLERPPEGPARGKYSLPAWSVMTLGGALALLGLVYFLFRIRRRSNR